MNELNSKTIKKILLGVILSDGCLNKTPNSARFDFYNKQKSYSEYIYNVVNNISNSGVLIKKKFDKRFNTNGYRVFTKTHRYFDKLYNLFYNNNKKVIRINILKKLNEQSLAHIWMCDGMLHFKWNKKSNSVQINGYFCLECFSKEELENFIKMLNIKFNIQACLIKVKWGNGWRVKVGGENLRKFISIIYPYVLDCFKYKCQLYYKNVDILKELFNTEQFVTIYKDLSEIEDIVRTRRNS